MNELIPIHLVVEDILSEWVLRTLIKQTKRPFSVERCLGHQGFGYIKRKIIAFNNDAKRVPYLVLCDLDMRECAPLVIRQWLTVPRHDNLLLRIAIREVESWILAHRSALADFLEIQETEITREPDELPDPKRYLIQLTRRSKKRELKEAIVAPDRSTAIQGPDYNAALSKFVTDNWMVQEARKYSPSLDRAYKALQLFQPVLKTQKRQ